MRALGRRLEHVRDDPSIPLCVKLEGTVLRSGTTGELALSLVRRRPWMIFWLLAWVFLGKEEFRNRVVDRAAFDPSGLAYRGPFLTYLRREAASGRNICLVARSKSPVARAIANHLGLFSDVIEVEGHDEPSGDAVAKALCARFGSGDFDYAGHEHADLPVWRTARRSVIVAPSPRLLNNHLWRSQTADVICPDDWISGRYAEALHPSRWFKNLLIFIPLFDAANRFDLHFVVSLYLAFCAYCLVASSGYIANDLIDLNADRRHVLKHRRPFASGRLAIIKGLVLSLSLALLGLGLSFFLSPLLTGWLCLYLALSLAYSLWIKKTLVLDVFVLTALSMHRVFTGIIVAGEAPSFWLVLFAGFLFFGLAVLGRYGELKSSRIWARRRATRALAYRSSDLDFLASFGLASCYVSVGILALFVLTPDAHAAFRTPEALWLLCPVLLYWIARVWIFARRGKVPEDPLQFAVRDTASIYAASAAIALLGVAIFVTIPLSF
ncbi:MAG TPA: UbiA family prenyltransferase [Rhizomicrobium sp.]|jgi:4-hydroxybenzoate polyprenyltransferase